MARTYIYEENQRDMDKYKSHVLSMETYASKKFENMHKGTFCYKLAKFTLKVFMHLPRIICKSISQQQDIFIIQE